MSRSRLFYFPVTVPFVLILFFLIGAFITLFQIGVLKYAYKKIGVDPHYAFATWIACLLGSYINIPVARLPAKETITNTEVTFFGMRYAIPVSGQYTRTIVPLMICCYLMLKNGFDWKLAAGILVVSAIIHLFARPIQGVGIVMPVIVPPLLAVAAAFAFSPDSRPAFAYIVGTLGTLIGADLTNLGKIREMHAPIISIGGAGTFDGIFLTGILAVLLT
jgi:uncharacterized membrane protein